MKVNSFSIEEFNYIVIVTYMFLAKAIFRVKFKM